MTFATLTEILETFFLRRFNSAKDYYELPVDRSKSFNMSNSTDNVNVTPAVHVAFLPFAFVFSAGFFRVKLLAVSSAGFRTFIIKYIIDVR